MYSINIAHTSSRTPAWPYAQHPWKFAAAAHVTGNSTVVLGQTTAVDTGSCNPEVRCGPQAGPHVGTTCSTLAGMLVRTAAA